MYHIANIYPNRLAGPFLLFILFFRNLVKPSEMPRPLALTGITAHSQKHFTSSDKTQKRKKWPC